MRFSLPCVNISLGQMFPALEFSSPSPSASSLDGFRVGQIPPLSLCEPGFVTRKAFYILFFLSLPPLGEPYRLRILIRLSLIEERYRLSVPGKLQASPVLSSSSFSQKKNSVLPLLRPDYCPRKRFYHSINLSLIPPTHSLISVLPFFPYCPRCLCPPGEKKSTRVSHYATQWNTPLPPFFFALSNPKDPPRSSPPLVFPHLQATGII